MSSLKPFLLIVLSFFIFSCNNVQEQTATETPEEIAVEEVIEEEPKDLFSKLRTYCGKTYPGKLLHSYAGPDFYKGKPMLIKLEYCNDNEISIPFAVGEDGSKTWKLSKTEGGFALRHQEVDEKGKPKNITNYGGDAVTDANNPFTLTFPANEETAKMISVAKDNIWVLDLDDAAQTLTYTIKRGKDTRFSVVFDLNTPVD